MNKYVLVTGGAGYIGTHTVVQLLRDDQSVIILDNLSNSSQQALHRVEELTRKSFIFIQGDVSDRDLLDNLFREYTIDAVVHFAGLKAVCESVELPLDYYHTNVQGTITLCESMAEHGIKKLVFSSSATVYGDPVSLPLVESMPTGQPTNPYGQSKLMVELVLRDLYHSDHDWQICVLRYFNPVGAHPSGLIGEDPNGIPNNLMPFISQVAVGRRESLSVFGNDYETHDGTGVRDYIHVDDLAAGHLCALKRLNENPGYVIYNLGTGKGYSVLDMVKAFERASAKPVPYTIAPRRSGDVASCYADANLAAKELNWSAKKGLQEMCEDTWRWQSQNPNGYED